MRALCHDYEFVYTCIVWGSGTKLAGDIALNIHVNMNERIINLSPSHSTFWFYMQTVRWLRKRMPPGPAPLPLFGNLLRIKGDVHRHLAELSREFGPLMTVFFDVRPVLILSSPAAVQEALFKKGAVYSSRPDALVCSKLVVPPLLYS